MGGESGVSDEWQCSASKWDALMLTSVGFIFQIHRHKSLEGSRPARPVMVEGEGYVCCEGEGYVCCLRESGQ